VVKELFNRLQNERIMKLNGTQINSYEVFVDISSTTKAACFYLSTPECNVCKILKPKVLEMIINHFHKMEFYFIDLNDSKEIAGQLSVFTAPTILIYFDGREIIRSSRNIYLQELKEQIDRYYKMIFD